MHTKQVYAVVDIEATGGSIGSNERIIQFACVLVKDGEILHTFDSLINPNKKIPKRITKLTGISSNDVKNAPFFEEIAPLIKEMLEDTIFVAHNVGFDYRFLNEQLEDYGFEPIIIPAIDTVELSQILYPSLDSYQLEELTSSLGYSLEDAHNALADAKATAYLLNHLFLKAHKLPLVTLEKLSKLSNCTTYQTYIFFHKVFEYASVMKEPLDQNLIIVNQLAIQKPEITNKRKPNNITYSYPYGTKKENLLNKNSYTYRENQSKMMDIIYSYLNKENSLEKLAIEAPPGIGKTLGYLFPALIEYFENIEDKPLLISTYTIMLQNQIIEETLPMLEKLLEQKINASIIKSPKHYISLDIFSRWLKTICSNDSEAFLSMRILVWLTETKTGDLSEINAGSHLDLNFWNEIRADRYTETNNSWTDFDFYERVKKSVNDSDLIITNHHFYVSDWMNKNSLFSNIENIIIDEAHQFPNVILDINTIDIKGNELLIYLDQLGSYSNKTKIFELLDEFEDKKLVKNYDVLGLERSKNILKETWTCFFDSIIYSLEKKTTQCSYRRNFIEQEFDFEKLTINQKQQIKLFIQSAEEFIYLSHKITNINTDSFKNISSKNQLLLINFLEITEKIAHWLFQIKIIFTDVSNQKENERIRWFSYIPSKVSKTFKFNMLEWQNNSKFIDYLANETKVIFTSSTLSYDNSIEYFSSQLKNLPMEYHLIENHFNYEKQVDLLLLDEGINPNELSQEKYAEELATNIQIILEKTKKNTLILFQSYEILNMVYKLLNETNEVSQHLLAQTISGTRHRILKEFKRNKPSVILGVNSFFEGIDLPADELEIVIMTRLPFPSPNTPLIKAKITDLERKNMNPFTNEILPRAILNMKQAFGRLIRSETDTGTFIILDSRFLTASYGKKFQDALPISFYKKNFNSK